MARVILISEDGAEDVIVGSENDEVEVFGTATEGEEVRVIEGDIVLSATFNAGGDIIRLPSEAEEYTATLQGSRLVLTSEENDVSISIPINPNATNTIVFGNDDTREVGAQADGNAFVGGQVIERGGTETLESDDQIVLGTGLDLQDAMQTTSSSTYESVLQQVEQGFVVASVDVFA